MGSTRAFTVFASLWAVGAMVAPVEAQVRNYGVVPGNAEHHRVFSFGAVQSTTCASVAPTLILRSVPQKGSVQFAEVTEPFPAKFENCTGKTANRTALQYSPTPGKLGFDRFFVLESGGPKGQQEYEVVIWISDPKAPNTAPPSPATVEALYGPPKTLEKVMAEQAAKLRKGIPQLQSQPSPATPAAKAAPLPSQTFVIPVNATGQYSTKIVIGTVSMDAIIDTGASAVSIPYQYAERLGLRSIPNAPKVMVKTAGGDKEVEIVVVPEMRIGPLIERSVFAVILPKDVDVPALIGMTFLSQLTSVQLANGKIVLSK